MAVLKNRAGVNTSTVGTGTITLGTAIAAGSAPNAAAWQTFAGAGVANGDSVRYLILDANGAWEYGPGTYTTAGTTLSRPATAMDGSVAGQKSSTGALLNLSGTAQVFVTAIAEDIGAFEQFPQGTNGQLIVGLTGFPPQYRTVTGDVGISATGVTAIAADAVTYAQMQNVSAASRLLGRGSAAGAGNVEEITLGAGLIMTATALAASGGYGDTGMINGTLAVSAAANALTVAIKTLAGADPSASDPVLIAFRDSTLTNGTYTVITLTAATSFVLSPGSTLGIPSAVPFRFWVVGVNDAGTFRLGVINCFTVTASVPSFLTALDEGSLVTSVAEGGAGGADATGQLYTTVAATSKPQRILGYVEWGTGGLATAGNWTTTNLARIQLYGPGVGKPGYVVSRTFGRTNTAVSNATASYVDTGLAASINLQSAANMVRISGVQTECYNATTGTGVKLRLVRGAGPTVVYQIADVTAYNSAGAQISAQGFDCLDSPYATGVLTYKTQFTYNAGASTAVVQTNSIGYSTMLLEEIMT